MKEVVEYKGYTIEVNDEECPANPRTEWDNLGTMVCFHKRYTLGDKDHGFRHEDYDSWDAMLKGIEKREGKLIALPIYMYDHSGITIRTSPFSCPWDSGQIGFIYITYEKARGEYSRKKITKAFRERIEGYLVAEVKVYDSYLTGDVHGFVIKKGDEEIDSCCGVYGDDALTEAKSMVDHLLKKKVA